MIKQIEQNVDQASLVQMINDMLAYPGNYPQGAVYPMIRALELLEEQQCAAEGLSQTPFTDQELVAINQYLDDDLSFQELKTYPGLIRKIATHFDITSIRGHSGEMNFYDRLVQAREEGDIPQQGVSEGLPGSLSAGDYRPGKTIKHRDTNCTTCHGRRSMYKVGNHLFADNRQGSIRVTCPVCQGTGDQQGVAEGHEETEETRVINMFEKLVKQGRDPLDMIAHKFGWGSYELDQLAKNLGFKNSAGWAHGVRQGKGVNQGVAEGSPQVAHKMALEKLQKALKNPNVPAEKKAEIAKQIEYQRSQLKQGVAEGSGKNVVKSIKVGNFRHDLVDTGLGWQVRIYNGDELYDTGLSKNSEQKGLAALEDAVAYTEKQTRTKRQGVAEDPR